MANIIWVEDRSHWIDRFTQVLTETDFDGASNTLKTFKFAEAAKQHIKLSDIDHPPDIAILDANMNGNDEAGFSVSRALRKKWPNVPIIYLSEHSGTEIEQGAFEHNHATDFIAKHQRNVEAVLCWRIKSVLRQSAVQETTSSNVIKSGDLTIDLSSWEVYWHTVKLMNPANPKRPLAPTPRKILRYLVEASPTPLNTGQIADKLNANTEKFSYASYRQHIKILRYAFDLAEGGKGDFLQQCKAGTYIVTFGDEGAYCWKPKHRAN
jgi:DNA-binding response OmpR family regulator